MVEEESEFGSGLVICLVKFAEHFENQWAMQIYHAHNFKDRLNDSDFIADYGVDILREIECFKRVYLKNGANSFEEGLSSLITSWANGASDHLYQLHVPKKWKRTKLGKMIENIKELGLDMGHGRGIMGGKVFTFEEFASLQTMTRDAALELDKLLWKTLKEKSQLDIGQW